MKIVPSIALAFVMLLGYHCSAALASPKTTKIYGDSGRRVGVIKQSNFGSKVYNERGRRVAIIKTR